MGIRVYIQLRGSITGRAVALCCLRPGSLSVSASSRFQHERTNAIDVPNLLNIRCL